MAISIYNELEKLRETGKIELRRDPKRHSEGEGSYVYGGRRITILPNYTGPCPGSPEFVLEQPHDVAWCKETNTFLAAALSSEIEGDTA